MTLKLDVSKAYDRVQWTFLGKILLRLGLHISFAGLIIMCITSVVMNRIQFGLLQPDREIRQGDC